MKPGDTISSTNGDSFQLTKQLGSGAFGEAWRCRHFVRERRRTSKNSNQPDVAVKISYSNVKREVLERESAILLKLRHANVLRILDVFEDSTNTQYLVTQLAECGDLRTLITPSCRKREQRSGEYEDLSTNLLFLAGNACDNTDTAAKATLHSLAVLCTDFPEHWNTIMEHAETEVTDFVESPTPTTATPFLQKLSQKVNHHMFFDMFKDEQHIWNHAYQILRGLEFAHRQGIVHRDLKPENIFGTASGVVLIGDFGISYEVSNVKEVSPGCGTTAYLPPESDMAVGPEADIWALGMTLAEMSTSRHPLIPNAQVRCLVPAQLLVRCLDCRGLYRMSHLHMLEIVPNSLSLDLCLLIDDMLVKLPQKRPSAKSLLSRNKFCELLLREWKQLPKGADAQVIIDDLRRYHGISVPYLSPKEQLNYAIDVFNSRLPEYPTRSVGRYHRAGEAFG